ncbi:MAG: MarR family transcriptional regulator [Candidatus Omnitrophica bacterium]|nr:MarR family transcriptional regulator [Candidatus Omnitrophota bacterium]MDD5671362.1 MarR family transcriptional regulator [Candidatus Omnitrophota bacterium]
MAMITLEAFGEKIADLFPRVARGIARYENNYLTKGAITLPQLWTLHYLLRQKGSSMRELAEFMKLGFSSTTGLVDRLEKQGLVERRRTETDRRMVYVEISAKGRHVLKQIFNQKYKATIKVFGTLTAQERSEYLHILEKLVAKLSENKES